MSRYARHFALPGFSMAAQQKLKNARIAIIGAGGLGIPVLQYLSAAGCAYLRIIDPDKVERMNLQRQVIFREKDCGLPKATLAAAWVKAFNPMLICEAIQDRLQAGNAMEYLKDMDVVIDATDNFPARYLICDATFFLQIPVVYGSVYRYAGQVSVFNHQEAKGKLSPNYRDLFPEPPGPAQIPDCSIGGVFGALTGIVGNMMAVETIKIICGIGQTLSGKLLTYDTLESKQEIFSFKSRADNPLSGEHPSIKQLIDYDIFCKMAESAVDVPGIAVDELHQLIQAGKKPAMLDVREFFELAFVRFDAVHIPEREIAQRQDEIPAKDPLIVYCKVGIRSARVVKMLKEQFPKRQILNLEGGIMAWREKYEPGRPEY